MKRLIIFTFIFFAIGLLCLFSNNTASAGNNLSALGMSYTRTAEEKLGEGTYLRTYNLKIGENSTRARKLVVELDNPYAEVQAMHPREGFNNRQTVKDMATDQDAVAAVNADLFHLTRPAAPFGLHMENGKILSSPTDNRSYFGFGIDEQKTAHILSWGFNGRITCDGEHQHSLYGYNQTYASGNRIYLYDRNWGREVASSFFGEPVLQVTVQGGRVTRVEETKSTAPVPADGFVLIAEGSGAEFLERHALPGSQVEYTLGLIPDMNLDTSVGGHIVVVDQGDPVDPGRLTSPGASRAPRTAVGIDAEGKKIYFVTIDGSSLLSGVTMEELSVFLSSLGIDRALNLDGGGSTSMVARHLGELQPNIINRPIYGSQRALPNAIGIFNRAPKTDADKLFVRGEKGLLIGTEADYRVTGHDRHYHPLDISPEDLRWEVSDREQAEVVDGTLKAKKQGEVTLKVSYQGASEEKTVYIYGGEDLVSLSVTPDVIQLLPGQKMPLTVQVKTKDGLTLEAGPSSVTWEADLGTVKENTYYAEEEGFGTLTAEIDGFKKEIPLRIGGKLEPFFTFREWQTTEFRSHPPGLPGSFKIEKNTNYIYRGERSGRLEYDFSKKEDGVMIAYGQLGSGRISMSERVLGVSAYIYGDNSKYWLRAEIFDAGGTRRYVDLADEIDWSGWKRVQGAVDPSWPQPLTLSSIYLVQVPEMRTDDYPKTGRIFIDHVEMIKGLEAEDKEAWKESDEKLPRLDNGTDKDDEKPGNDLPFIDLEGHWGKTYLLDLVEAGILQGYGDKTIRPDRTVSRAEYVALLQRVFWADETPGQKVGGEFKDDLPSWAEEAVALAVEKGVVQGYEDGTFRPHNPITRSELAAMTNLALHTSQPGDSNEDNIENLEEKLKAAFNDYDEIPSWAWEHVYELYSRELVQGSAGSFNPGSKATRAEAAVVFWKILN